MLDWIILELPQWVGQYGPWLVAACLLLLLAGGFGVPVPEDVPLLISGYLCYCGVISLWAMIPLAFATVLLGDWTVYGLGRRYGYRITLIWFFRRFLTARRLAKAGDAFHAHGGKTLFIARFLPGLRTPVFFSAGMFRIPFWKMLAFDGSAALLSVPGLILIAYFAGTQLKTVRLWTTRAQLGLLGVGLLVVGLLVAVHFFRRRRRRQALAERP